VAVSLGLWNKLDDMLCPLARQIPHMVLDQARKAHPVAWPQAG
jgi:hypothetical protein